MAGLILTMSKLYLLVFVAINCSIIPLSSARRAHRHHHSSESDANPNNNNNNPAAMELPMQVNFPLGNSSVFSTEQVANALTLPQNKNELLKKLKSKQWQKKTKKTVKKKASTARPFVPVYRNKNKFRVLNQIDGCWRNDPYWNKNRQKLADCVIGYGDNTRGGKGGSIYVVTDASDDNPANPKYGTLRWGVVQTQPLWIVFARDMTIVLKNELMVNSYKTIDGRGVNVEIAYGPCITIQYVQQVIIHGLSIHHCTEGKPGMVMSSTNHVGYRLGSDGDAINVFGSTNIWIDHNYLASCFDGLVDVIHASTYVTISNNYLTNHNKVMLLGHSDTYGEDRNMRVTVIYNHFGPGLIQRLPRCRFGYFHVVNNRYSEWGMYALGASANPTIRSDGNYFYAPNDPDFKQVTKLEGSRQTSSSSWRSVGDLFLNGAFFGQLGTSTFFPRYSKQDKFVIQPAILVPALTASAGPLKCYQNVMC